MSQKYKKTAASLSAVLVLSGCAGAKPPSVSERLQEGQAPVALSKEEQKTDEGPHSVWTGVKTLSDQVRIFRPKDSAGELEVNTKKYAEMISKGMPEEDRAAYLDGVDKASDGVIIRGIGKAFDVVDIGLMASGPAGIGIRNATDLVFNGGGAIIGDIGHYVFGAERENDEGPKTVGFIKTVGSNIADIPSSLWGVVKSTGQGIVNLVSPDGPSGQVVDEKPLHRASLKLAQAQTELPEGVKAPKQTLHTTRRPYGPGF